MNRMGRIRAKLHARNPHCIWCGRLTTLLSDMKQQGARPEVATIEHLFERRCDLGRDMSVRGKRWALACARCNSQRGTAHSRKINIALGPDACRARTELGHRVKRCLSWKQLIHGYVRLDLGDIMDTVRESSPHAAVLA